MRNGKHSILTDELVQQIEETVREDCQLTVYEISATFPQLIYETLK